MDYITDVKIIQKLNLDLMCEFDEFCRENKIKYNLGGGTLIGAVRHKGFIPWDDDVDIMMMRKDYERLLSLRDKMRNKYPLRQIVSIRDKTFARDYARYIRKDYYKEEMIVDLDDCPYIGLDIFPIVFVPKNKILYLAHYYLYYFFRVMMVAATSQYNTGTSKRTQTFKNIIRPVVKKIGKFKIAFLCEKIGMMTDRTCKTCVAAISGMAGKKEKWLYKECKAQMQFKFEDQYFWGPRNFDIYLKNIYGDYMKLPPEDQRKVHGMKIKKIDN